MKKTLLLPIAAAMLGLQSPLVLAQANTASTPATAAINQRHDGWLGVYIRPMPGALTAQLSGLMPSGEGILVAQVQPQSPAAKAGIEANDILLSLDGQKLYSPAQLTRLVASSKAGKQVDLKVIRHGKVIDIKAQIGQRADQGYQPPRPFFRPPAMPQPHFNTVPHRIPKIQPHQTPALAWDSFESVEVKTLKDGRYHAAVSFKDKNNEVKNFTFEGKKEEIVQQIKQQKDLPDDKRTALLNALNMDVKPGKLPFKAPWLPGNPFNDPFFNNAPFDQSWWRDPFFSNGQNPFRGSFFNRFFAPQPPLPPQQRPWQRY